MYLDKLPIACVLSHFSQVQLCPWDSPGMNPEVGCHAFLQGIFPTQGSNPHFLSLLHWQAGSLPLVPPVCVLSHVRLSATTWTAACQAPLSMRILQVRIMEWVAMPSSRGSS